MDFHPKLVAFDLDGTLAESKQRVSSDTGVLIAQLLQKMPVAIMSGAGFSQFEKQFFPALPDDTQFEHLYIFADNAAQCFVYKNKSWHPQYNHAFTPVEKEHIQRAIDEARAEVNFPTPAQTWGEVVEDRGAQISYSPLGQQAPLPEKEKWHAEHDADRQRLRDALEARLPEFAVATGGSTTIDITRKGITKAYGIKRLTELTGVLVTNILYVGDALDEGGNDAVVKETGVHTHQVFSPGETEALIEAILADPASHAPVH